MEFSYLDETCCGLLCQHPSCWSSLNRIVRSIPTKARSVMKLDAVNYDNSRDEENNREKEEEKGRKGDNVFDGGMIITGPTVCDLLKSFPNCSEPLSPIDANSDRRRNKYGLYTDIDSQESPRFQVPKCPPGSVEKLSIQSSEENKVLGVHIVQAFIINEDSDSVSQPQYVWIPAKKKETKENAFNGGQMPSTQIFEASQVLECDKKQREKSLADVCDDWTTWMSSSKFRYKTNKCRYKRVAGVERQKTISSDLGFRFSSGSLHQRASEHLVGRKLVRGDLLQAKGLSADSRIFWKPTSVIGSATNKRCPFTLESSQASSPDDFFWDGTYNFQKRFKMEFGTRNKGEKESVKLPAFEVPHGKLATISLELGSKDKHSITQPMNFQKKGVDFSLVPVSPSTGNLLMRLEEQEKHLNKAVSEGEKQKESKDEPGIIGGYEDKNADVPKEGRRQKKERFENISNCTFQPAQRISFTETIDAFDPDNWCRIEAMPLHRVRIPNTQTTSSLKQPPVCSRKKTHGRISNKRRPVATMKNHQTVTSSPSIELPKAITTKKSAKGESTDKVDFRDLPKPPPPSPQMLSNFNRSPSPRQLFASSRSGSLILLKKPKTVSYLEPAEICKPWP